MLRITTEAANHLQNVRRERGVDAGEGVRFVSAGGRVGLTFAPAPSPGDKVVDAGEMKVYVAADVVPLLDRTIIDARAEDGSTGLVIRRKTAATKK
jgi:Fe-S cluster assembly iron-binding protein IscA